MLYGASNEITKYHAVFGLLIPPLEMILDKRNISISATSEHLLSFAGHKYSFRITLVFNLIANKKRKKHQVNDISPPPSKRKINK